MHFGEALWECGEWRVCAGFVIRCIFDECCLWRVLLESVGGIVGEVLEVGRSRMGRIGIDRVWKRRDRIGRCTRTRRCASV